MSIYIYMNSWYIPIRVATMIYTTMEVSCKTC